jgi:hypothetical protein
MYNREEERATVLKLLRESSQVEMQYTKQQNFERAVSLAMDEVKEIEQEFNRFLGRVSHLEVFQHTMKEPLTQDVSKHLQNLSYMITKNYTKEEKESMPYEVLEQVKATQDKRVDLLQKVARRYLSKAKRD